jgi:hypothetical protein
MGLLGLVPSEYSSGAARRQGAITKTGNSHARRVLVEAGWNYRFPARVSRASQVRQGAHRRCDPLPSRRSEHTQPSTTSPSNRQRTGHAMREHDEGNPQNRYVGIRVMIPDARARQPCDGQMNCGNQSADISMIRRRPNSSRVACPLRFRFINFQHWDHKQS